MVLIKVFLFFFSSIRSTVDTRHFMWLWVYVCVRLCSGFASQFRFLLSHENYNNWHCGLEKWILHSDKYISRKLLRNQFCSSRAHSYSDHSIEIYLSEKERAGILFTIFASEYHSAAISLRCIQYCAKIILSILWWNIWQTEQDGNHRNLRRY